jgi:hypothetical protein
MAICLRLYYVVVAEDITLAEEYGLFFPERGKGFQLVSQMPGEGTSSTFTLEDNLPTENCYLTPPKKSAILLMTAYTCKLSREFAGFSTLSGYPPKRVWNTQRSAETNETTHSS